MPPVINTDWLRLSTRSAGHACIPKTLVNSISGSESGTSSTRKVKKRAPSIIQQIAEGCGVLENWTGTLGGSGKSINFYDPTAARWYQYWIGANGIPSRYEGTYKDGAMRYEGEAQSAAGKVRTRLTFFNLDTNTVRQLAEQSADDGKTWTTTYDFKYSRKKSA